jgi:hypothetical protein
MDSPFSKYEWLELVGQRQDGQILSSSDFFILGIFSPSDSKGWLEFHHQEGNRATSLKKSQTVFGKKGRQPLTKTTNNKSFSERETTVGKNKMEQIHGKPQATLGKGDNLDKSYNSRRG